jgi:iron complex transport system permease protein
VLSVKLLFLVLLAGAAMVASLALGATHLSPASVVRALAGDGEDAARTIVLQLRLPRAVLAALVGGGLALCGAVFQSLLRNPLAEPYVLGISGGAAVGAVAVVVLGLGEPSPWALPVAAFLGAVLTMWLVLYIAARAARRIDMQVLLLAGVVVGAFFNAVILLLLSFAGVETFRSAVFWMMGSLVGASWTSVILLAVYLIPGTALLLMLARPLNLLALGEETALYLGTRVERVKLAAYVLASLLVAASVAMSGVVGFVGLVVPHALRLVWGSDQRRVLPASLLGGASFLLLADTLGRTLAAPAELPVGVVTALVGVPLFVALLTRRSA